MIRTALALAVVAASSLLTPIAALACEPPDPARVPVDRPVAVAPDGSFVDASSDDEWSFLRGLPVRDVGGGRVSQVIEEDPSCDVLQGLLFVDCTAGAALIVRAVRQETEWTADGRLIAESTRLLQPPHGPLTLTPTTTVADVGAVAAQQGWPVETDPLAFAAAQGPRNRFDPFMRCRLFYPGSAGTGRAGG